MRPATFRQPPRDDTRPSSGRRNVLGAAAGAFLAAIGLLVGAAPIASADELQVTSTAIPLNPTDPSQNKVGALTYLGGVVLASEDKRFGGLSGLLVSNDGRSLLAISDRGYWFSGTLVEDSAGRLTAIGNTQIAAMLDTYSQPVSGSWSDAEALTRGAGVSVIVGFERRHRLWRYDVAANPGQAPAVELPTPAELEKAPSNGGLEAVAAMADGRLLAITEDFIDGPNDRVGWIMQLQTATYSPVRYTPAGLFKPTDAVGLPNGDLLVLERRYTKVGGVAARLARVDAAQILPRARLSGEELAVLQPPLNVDNMEGLAARVGPNGEIFIYMVSDDNFNRVAQRTLLMKFRLDLSAR